jgi:ABC-2 type transport system permease protein
MTLPFMFHAFAVRRVSLVWWTIGLALTAVAIAGSYPSVRSSGSALDDYADSLPQELLELFGAQSLTDPAGYLNSQFFANFLPVLLIVFGIGIAGWTIAGTEQDGTLETALANPVPRWRLAVERYLAVVLGLAWLTAVSVVSLIAVRDPFDLGSLGASRLLAAGAGCFALALAFASVAYAVGAATGSRTLAIGVAAGAAAGTYLLQGLALFVDAIGWLREFTPWGWFLDSGALQTGWSWPMLGWPLLVSVALAVGGTLRFQHRDLR